MVRPHLIGRVNINAILDVLQGLVQVAGSGCSKKTIASICLQMKTEKEERRDMEGIETSERHKKEQRGKWTGEYLVTTFAQIGVYREGSGIGITLVHQLSNHLLLPLHF